MGVQSSPESHNCEGIERRLVKSLSLIVVYMYSQSCTHMHGASLHKTIPILNCS